METGNGAVVEGSIVRVEPSSSMEANVGMLMRRATDVAGVCREIVLKTAQAIQGRRYVRVEGWQSVAVAYGCVASSRDVEKIPGGIRAIGEVRRMSDGAVVATAEGFVGDDEKTWAARPEYARRAMAQTRAISRACRSAFAFVVTLIDGDLSTTPFEEVDGTQGTIEPPAPVGSAGLREKLRQAPPSPPKQTQQTPPGDGATHDRNLTLNYGRGKGTPLSQLAEGDLQWYRKTLTESVADPDKERFLVSNQRALDAVTAELAFRGL